jgi:hypothetical protein
VRSTGDRAIGGREARDQAAPYIVVDDRKYAKPIVNIIGEDELGAYAYQGSEPQAYLHDRNLTIFVRKGQALSEGGPVTTGYYYFKNPKLEDLERVSEAEGNILNALGGVTNSTAGQKPYFNDNTSKKALTSSLKVNGFKASIINAKKQLKTSEISNTVSSQKQKRHLAGTKENNKNGGGYMNSLEDAQSVLDAVHSGKATLVEINKAGFPVYRVDGVTGTNVNAGAGITDQPTNVFIIKGTKSPSVVPTNPNYKSK